VRIRTKSAVAALVLLCIAGVAWVLAGKRRAPAFTIPETTLANWTLVTSDGTDPWVVAMKPPEPLLAQLLAELRKRGNQNVAPVPHAALPLVLRSEFDEGLQGVYGTDSVLRIAREAGIESGTFQPLCLAHRTSTGAAGQSEVYFVPFDSAAFNEVRVDLVPIEPEHAGVGVYEPATLTPLLIVAATPGTLDQWLPLAFDRATDCEADLTTNGIANR
jgi:hypothetical protein